MDVNITRELTSLKRMTITELRKRHAEVTGEDTRSRHKGYLIRRIVWHLQAKEEGDISQRAQRRADELAKGTDIRITAPRNGTVMTSGPTRSGSIEVPQDDRLPMPGAIITREYKGDTILVKVLPKGFEYNGEIFRSLSAVAKKVTGTHWNGRLFFGLKPKNKRIEQ